MSVDIEEMVFRPTDGLNIALFLLIFSLYLLKFKRNIIKNYYLYMVIASSFLIALISATRGWILAFSFIFIVFEIFGRKDPAKALIRIMVPVILIVGITISVPNIRKQLTFSFQRMSTLETIAQGDITAGGTLKRMTERGPRVMSKFSQSPIIGFGFSNGYYNYRDGHVGNQTLLLNGGVIGFGIVIFFMLSYLATLYQRNRKLSKANSYKDSLIVFFISMLGIFIIHSTSRQILSFSTPVMDGVMYTLFFMLCASDLVMKEAHAEQLVHQVHEYEGLKLHYSY
jgi:hypothetical protein